MYLSLLLIVLLLSQSYVPSSIAIEISWSPEDLNEGLNLITAGGAHGQLEDGEVAHEIGGRLLAFERGHEERIFEIARLTEDPVLKNVQ